MPQDILQKINLKFIWNALLAVLAVIVFLLGISKPLWRLGRGFFSRKIAIFADTDNFNSLKKLLLDTKLFRKKNIIHVSSNDALSAGNYSMLLLHWKSYSAGLESVLDKKEEEAVMIIYLPQHEGFIPREDMEKISRHKNVAVANFRGRVLSDVITGLMITEHRDEKR